MPCENGCLELFSGAWPTVLWGRVLKTQHTQSDQAGQSVVTQTKPWSEKPQLTGGFAHEDEDTHASLTSVTALLMLAKGEIA